MSAKANPALFNSTPSALEFAAGPLTPAKIVTLLAPTSKIWATVVVLVLVPLVRLSVAPKVAPPFWKEMLPVI